ncbi:ABC transporter substrate-binding protein [Fusicatenibacter faecihominis]|uniref:ABC transporter substrate-binding protein n=1 Tax=Fusicatenibacter faecihominis TaxID=2881276 RepID=A0AAE3DV57_9FIRM|nr:ABC transporter substrate-binding protein [Fusicatenibacter faecihominis]MCC2191361.1 ABC transporter substrate-binding protein [Fusicatenibacter faecihominis]
MKRKWALLMAGVMAFGMAMTGSAAEAETNTDLSGTLEVWGWTTDPEYQIEAFEKAYPNVTVNYTMIGTDYDTKMQTIVDNRTEGPDVFYADVKTVKNYIESDAWETLTDDPYNIDVSDSEDYTVKLGSDSDGNVKALSYQATPGGFWYKRDLAKKYLGTDDPDEISEMLSTTEGMLDVAEKLKEGSNGETHMFASYKDLWQFANYGMRSVAWVDGNKFQMDDYIPEFFDLAKTVRDNDYDAKIDTWSEAWYASCADDSVFGYAEPTWGLQYVIQTGAPDSEGNWGIASMPAAYFNGGSYLGVYQESQNKELAAEYVKFVCTNKDFLTQYANDKGDYTSLKSVNKEIADSGYEESWCAGQNTFKFFSDQMDKINTDIVTKYDDTIGNLMLNNVDLYLNGQLDKDAAIAQFKDDVASNYRRLDVE